MATQADDVTICSKRKALHHEQITMTALSSADAEISFNTRGVGTIHFHCSADHFDREEQLNG